MNLGRSSIWDREAGSLFQRDRVLGIKEFSVSTRRVLGSLKFNALRVFCWWISLAGVGLSDCRWGGQVPLTKRWRMHSEAASLRWANESSWTSFVILSHDVLFIALVASIHALYCTFSSLMSGCTLCDYAHACDQWEALGEVQPDTC